MPRYLDLDKWSRRKHFDLFRSYDRPFFNICANVDVTPLLEATRANPRRSFFLSALHLSTKAANEIEPFRFRLRGDRVLVHEVIHPSSTVLRHDETFGFAYFRFDEDYDRFHEHGERVIRQVRDSAAVDPQDDRDDQIHYSVIPWITFTSFAHARRFGIEDSTPKIVFGKYVTGYGRTHMPISVEVHHALMDGLHVGRYFDLLAEYVADFKPPK